MNKKFFLFVISRIALARCSVEKRVETNAVTTTCSLEGVFDKKTEGMIEARYLSSNDKRLVEITVDIDFKKFRGLKDKDKLEWSINTSWNSKKTALTGKKGCKVERTRHHYDPKVRCGPLSEKVLSVSNEIQVIKDAMCVKKDGERVGTNSYECSKKNTKLCERGDLSGKFGKLKVKSELNTLKTFKKVVDDNFASTDVVSDSNDDFSFVLMKGDKRMLCAQAIFTCV